MSTLRRLPKHLESLGRAFWGWVYREGYPYDMGIGKLKRYGLTEPQAYEVAAYADSKADEWDSARRAMEREG